jgi:hypothetical protein
MTTSTTAILYGYGYLKTSTTKNMIEVVKEKPNAETIAKRTTVFEIFSFDLNTKWWLEKNEKKKDVMYASPEDITGEIPAISVRKIVQKRYIALPIRPTAP